MASVDGKEEYDAFNSRMEEKNPQLPKQVSIPAPVASRSNYNVKKQPQAQNKGKVNSPAPKPYSQGYSIPKLSRMPWKMCFRCPEQFWNYKRRRKPDENIRNCF
ncbi:hypothetical protein O181_105755 [Austropuccinia psidii MF-1]|uniref:Uncharacterized protein n=1 Tax=Austropuccinia psidii MF-1 TaxID=1389203 RepID=A0A9Q3JMA1_9BASI|nr:hypothetical protein [Austropuccinia psidii MF-1]